MARDAGIGLPADSPCVHMCFVGMEVYDKGCADSFYSTDLQGAETDSLLRLETLSERCTMICLGEDDSEDIQHRRCIKALQAPPSKNVKRLKKLPICFPLHQIALCSEIWPQRRTERNEREARIALQKSSL